MFLSYAPLNPGNENFIFLYGGVFFIMLMYALLCYKKWQEGSWHGIVLLCLLYLIYSFMMLFLFIGFLQALIFGFFMEIYRFSLAFGYASSAAGNIILVLFINEIKKIKKSTIQIICISNLILGICLILPNNYYGWVDAEVPLDASIRPYTSVAMAIIYILTYLFLFVHVKSTIPQIQQKWLKNRFQSIAITQIFMIGYVFLNIIDTLYFLLTENEGYSIFLYLAWLCIVIASFFQYNGYITINSRQELKL